MAGLIKMPLTDVSCDPGDIVLDGDPAPLQRRGTAASRFSAQACCGQTAGWMKMPLGTEVGLDPGHIVLDSDPAPFQKMGTAPSKFWAHVCCGRTAGWIKMPVGTKEGLSPGLVVLDGDPAPSKGTQSPNFQPMSVMAKRSPISSTAELLFRYVSRQTDIQTCWLQHFAPLSGRGANPAK